MSHQSTSDCFAFRKPVRLSLTICFSTFAELERVSMEQGRSRSNLAAYLLEAALAESSSRRSDD
jgi:hypothetical protein